MSGMGWGGKESMDTAIIKPLSLTPFSHSRKHKRVNWVQSHFSKPPHLSSNVPVSRKIGFPVVPLPATGNQVETDVNLMVSQVLVKDSMQNLLWQVT